MSDPIERDVQRRVRESFEAEVAAWDGSATRRAMAAIRARPRAGRSLALGSVLAPVVGAVIVVLLVVVILATRLTPSPGPAGPLSGASASPAGSASAEGTPSTGESPSPSGTGSMRPTASPDPTHEPTSTLAASPTAPPSPVIMAGEFGRLLLPVPVFAEPDASTEPIQLLERGRDLWAPQDPEVIDGSLWYRVEFRRLARNSDYMFGWLPGVWEGQAVLRPLQARCFLIEQSLKIPQLTNPEFPVCFGDEDLEMVGTVQKAPSGNMLYSVRPRWRAIEESWWLRDRVGSAAQGWAFRYIHVDPASGLEMPEAGMIRVTGHFDDPSSSECVREPAPGYPESLPGEDEAWCRQQFVVTEIERLTE